ncbi:MAG: tRNA (adenosine(37)-N6)-threonylcarbamoyltransferase complex transferase subunit TsaD [Patescibacteria group bacterium]
MAAKNTKTMKILAIDTSCDDTAIAVLEIRNLKLEILSNVVSSQVKLHAKYGGVYPMLAKREHLKNLPLVFKRAMKGIKMADIDLIAVTNGPGLEPCLWQGINFAKELAEKLKKPLISVNHIEGHILANLIEGNRIPLKLPAICLVVSGGHTQLILMKGIGKYRLVGETRDDAAGECFDKAARILGLGYPGGPIISKLAKTYRERVSVCLPRPMMYTKDYDFSFSGLKTAVLYKTKEFKKINSKIKTEFCHEIQQAIIDVLIKKTIKAAKDFRVKSIILGGGVTANRELRKQFGERIDKEIPDIKYLIPDTKYSTDNAAMIAVAAYFNRNQKIKNFQNIKANGNLKIC